MAKIAPVGPQAGALRAVFFPFYPACPLRGLPCRTGQPVDFFFQLLALRKLKLILAAFVFLPRGEIPFLDLKLRGVDR